MDHLLQFKEYQWQTSKPSLLLQVGSLIYSFCWEKKNYQLSESCHKWNVQYPQPVQFSKSYCSKNNK